MEWNMERNEISCLDTVIHEVHNTELTQQIKLPDGMPDIGRILASWGQAILRGKEWRDGEITVTGGMMVWVLYLPENGDKECCIDTWIPFQMKWDLEEDLPEGNIRIRLLTRFTDGRSVSPRKIMMRCSVSALAEVYIPCEREIAVPAMESEDVQMLRATYPLRLPVEAGEKVFVMDEDLTLPESAPQPEKLIYSRMNPRITERRVLGDKLAFRGTGNLHILYRSDEGQLHSWDFELPFSQLAQLEQEHGNEAQSDLALVLTNLETELDDEGHLRLKAGVAGQYLITERQMVSLVEDAYSPERELKLNTQELELPVILENRQENLYGEQLLPVEGNVAADASFQMEFPRQHRKENGIELEFPGNFQVLYYGKDGSLQSANARWEGKQMLKADERSKVAAVPIPAEPQVLMGNGEIQLRTEFPVDLTTGTRQRMPMVSDVEIGAQRNLDENRPTLILRRTGDMGLWVLAKTSGSTVEDIRSINGLQGEPMPGQMLLIPVR